MHSAFITGMFEQLMHPMHCTPFALHVADSSRPSVPEQMSDHTQRAPQSSSRVGICCENALVAFDLGLISSTHTSGWRSAAILFSSMGAKRANSSTSFGEYYSTCIILSYNGRNTATFLYPLKEAEAHPRRMSSSCCAPQRRMVSPVSSTKSG